jgi:hypothetical protein
MLYDANTQQSPSHVNPSSLFTSQTVRLPVSAAETGSHGFSTSPLHPFEQAAVVTKRTSTVLHTISVSNQSTDDYPRTSGSSIINSSAFRSQMSHDQHMQYWHQHEARKIQEKRLFGYTYGPMSSPATADGVTTATILTPQIISTDNIRAELVTSPNSKLTVRKPTKSPFLFPSRVSTQFQD